MGKRGRKVVYARLTELPGLFSMLIVHRVRGVGAAGPAEPTWRGGSEQTKLR